MMQGKFINRYDPAAVTLYDMVRSVIAFKMDKREIDPAMVRQKLTDPLWMHAHVVDLHQLESQDWEDWVLWCRQEFGYTLESMAALCDRMYPPQDYVEPVDASLGVV